MFHWLTMEENKTKRKKPDTEDPGPEMNQRSIVEVVNRYFVGDEEHTAKQMRRIDRWINRSLTRIKDALKCIEQQLPDNVTMKPELYHDLIDREEGDNMTICRLQKDSLEIVVDAHLYCYSSELCFGSPRLPSLFGERTVWYNSGWKIKQAIEWVFGQLALLPEP